MTKQKTYYQLFNIRKPYRDFKMLDEYEFCPLCKATRQLCRVGMMRDFRFNWKRCSVCLIKIPIPQYIQRFFNRLKKKELPKGQHTL